MNEQRAARKGGGGERQGFAPPGTGTGAQRGRRATSPATLHRLGAELRGPPWPRENLRAAAELKAVAQLAVVAELREAAAIVVRGYGPAGGAPWPAIVVLNEALQRPEMKL